MSLKIKTKYISGKTAKIDKAIKELQNDSMVKLTLSIPKKLRSEFKIEAELNNTNMTEVVLQYIKQYIRH